MGKIVCMASAKGGSGKTVLTATFASFLSSLNKRVLMIDTDASTNGLSLLYLKEIIIHGEHAIGAGRSPKGIYELKQTFNSPEIVSLSENIKLIPATYGFQNTELVPINEFVSSLKFILNRYRDEFDFIFLDAQAGSDIYAHVAMRRDISNEVVIVSEYDPLSAAGVERLKALFRDELTYDRTWVLLNKMLPDFIKSFSDFLEVAKYLNPIPWDADVVKAYARRRLALDMEYGNEFTIAVMQTLRTLFRDEISKELDDWMKEKSVALRTPIETQYRDLEKQLENLISQKFESEIKNSKIRLRKRLFYFSTFFALITAIFLFGYLNLDKEKLLAKEISIKWIIFGISVMVAFGSVLSYYEKFTQLRKEAGSYKEKARIQREIDLLEDRLKKLEVLKNSGIETLVRAKTFEFK